MARLSLRGSKAAGMALGKYFEGDEMVIADVQLVFTHRRAHREVLEPKERPIDAPAALPACGLSRGGNVKA
eukprot:15478877-Alexandrium_andersonii.AAC.1